MNAVIWPSPETLAAEIKRLGIWRAVRDALWASELDTTALVVALRLVESLPHPEPSVVGIAVRCGIDERTVQRALGRLVDIGILTVTKRTGRRSAYAFSGAITPGTEPPLPPAQSHPTPGTESPPTPGTESPKAVPDLKLTIKAGEHAREARGTPHNGIFDAPSFPAPPSRSWTLPLDWRPKDHHMQRIAALKLDPEHTIRTFGNYDAWDRPHSNWDKCFAMWIERAKMFRDTAKAKR